MRLAGVLVPAIALQKRLQCSNFSFIAASPDLPALGGAVDRCSDFVKSIGLKCILRFWIAFANSHPGCSDLAYSILLGSRSFKLRLDITPPNGPLQRGTRSL